jgi:hypothetical protein
LGVGEKMYTNLLVGGGGDMMLSQMNEIRFRHTLTNPR